MIPLTLNSPSVTRQQLEDASPELVARWFSAIRAEMRTSDGEKRWALEAPYTKHSSELSILTQNVWGVPGLTSNSQLRFDALGDFLKTSSFDVVALQEMWDARTKQILERANFPYVVTSPGFPGLTRRAGLAICSRHPIINTYHLSFKNYGGVESAVRKGALAARILLPNGTSKLIVNTHLVSPTEKLSYLLCSERRTAAIRIAQISELSAWLDEISTKGEEDRIVLGDFNAPENTVEYQVMRNRLGVDLYRSRLPLGVKPSSFQPE